MLPLIPRLRREIAPGAVHIPAWLSIEQQKALLDACRQWAVGPAPMRHTRLPSGGVMSVQTVCLGWHWLPYRYARTADDVDGAPVKPFPAWLGELSRQAVLDAFGDYVLAAGYAPDAALVNFYDASPTPTSSWSQATCLSLGECLGSPFTGCQRCTPGQPIQRSA